MYKVSIVIPTYKRPEYLNKLLASINRQTFKDYEIIVVDDNSPNQAEYKIVYEKYKDMNKEFTLLKNASNRGAPYSRNRGINAAKYDLIALVDDDDEWLPLKLEKQVEIFENNDPTLDLVYTWADALNADGKIVYQYRSAIEGCAIKDILKECFIPSSSVMIKKRAIQNAGLFDETFPSCQDWDMWTRMLLQGSRIGVVHDVCMLHNVHLDTIGNSKKAVEGYYRYYRKHLFSSLKFGNFENIKKLIWAFVNSRNIINIFGKT